MKNISKKVFITEFTKANGTMEIILPLSVIKINDFALEVYNVFNKTVKRSFNEYNDITELLSGFKKALRNNKDAERRLLKKNNDGLKTSFTHYSKIDKTVGNANYPFAEFSGNLLHEFCLKLHGTDLKNEPTKFVAPTTPKVDLVVEPLDLTDKPAPTTIDGIINDTVERAVYSNYTDGMITKLIHEKLDEYGIKPSVKTVTVDNLATGKKVDIGLTHNKFEDVLKAVSARLNVFLVGEAGSGKTTAGVKVAEALNLEFASMSVSGETSIIDFFGYKDANGNINSTEFQRFYTDGGVFLIDEFDAGNPNVLAVINQALANGSCMFAEGMKTRHDDFVCMASGNTVGHGATSEYIGRNAIDGATLDRFVQIEFNIDENLETAISSNRDWCEMVQKIRANARAKEVRAIITPRATLYGEKLIATGMDIETVLKYTVYKGLNDDEINLIKL